MRRCRFDRSLLGAAALALMVAAGCSLPPDNRTITEMAVPEGTPKASLDKLVVSTLTTSFLTPWTDSVANESRALDLANAAAFDGAVNAQDALTKAGFEDGYVRFFSSDAGEVEVFVFRFGNADGATSYLNRIVSRYPADSTPFQVKTLDAATGLVVENSDGTAGAAVYLIQGTYMIGVVGDFLAPSPPVATIAGVVADTARQQVAAL